MYEKSVDKTDSSSNFWKITPLTDEMNSSAPPSPSENSQCQNPSIEIKHLGVEKVDPNCYSQQYGSSLKSHIQLPDIVKKVKQVERVTLAAEQQSKYFMGLEGDIHALCMIDLDKEGLGEYKKYLKEKAILNCEIEQKKDTLNKPRKTKAEIVKLELGFQELESIDLYKERLQEYKQAIKPAHCANTTTNIINSETPKEEKEDNIEKKPDIEVPVVQNVAPVSITPNPPVTIAQPCQTNQTNNLTTSTLTNPTNLPDSANLTNSTNVNTSNNPLNITNPLPVPFNNTTNQATLNLSSTPCPPVGVNSLNNEIKPNIPNCTKPLLSHPTNYPYNSVQNLYYLLQLNLLKNSLLQHYLQNLSLAKYISSNPPNRASVTNFIMNRNFF